MKKIINIAIIITVIISLFFIKFNYKNFKIGNNKNNKTANEIANYILDIKSYEAKEEITINSNKNTNKYVVIEKYHNDDNLFQKEILKPENLQGMLFFYDGNDLKIENGDLKKTYESYKYIGEENISLIGFINSFKESKETNIKETNEEVIMTVKLKNGNKYMSSKKLFINRKDLKPIKMEIKNISQNTTVYILYNEIKINNLQKDDMYAFKIRNDSSDI